MCVINKLILQGQKEIKKPLALQWKKERVFQNFYRMDGLILIVIYIPNKSNIHGGV
jgi:hypothetical protein